jgi:hypothetical protein
MAATTTILCKHFAGYGLLNQEEIINTVDVSENVAKIPFSSF